MTAAIGFPTLRLVRSQLSPLSINDMQSADVRQLDLYEIKSCFNHKKSERNPALATLNRPHFS